jgi:hypothetical protein
MPPSGSKASVWRCTVNAVAVVASTLIDAPPNAACLAIGEKGPDLVHGRSSAHD